MKARPEKRLQKYVAIVTLSLLNGTTWEDAEMDSDEAVGDNRLEVVALSRSKAADAALDEFHSTVSIGILDNVETTVKVYTVEEARKACI